MSTNLPKWSGKSGRRASGATDRRVVVARRTPPAAALFACALLVACGSGGAPDVGSGTPAPAGPINWGAEQTLATNPPGVTPPTAVFGVNGTAAVLWSQVGMPLPGSGTPSTVPLVGVRESSAGATFATAEAVETPLVAFAPTDTIAELSAAPSGAGTAAVWRRGVPGIPGDRLGSVLREAGGWSFETIGPTVATTAAAAGLVSAVNAAGARVAVWTELVGATRLVRLSTRTAGASWAAPISFSAADSDSPAVAIDTAGMAMVVWRQGTPGLIRARSFDTASATPGVELPVDATQITNDGRNPRVIAIGANQFVTTWEQAGGGGAYDLRANRGSSAAWLNAQQTVDTSAATADQSRLAAGTAGAVYVVWRQSNAVFLSRFNAGSGLWTVPSEVGLNLTGASANPQIATDGNGNAVIVWVESGTTNDVVYAQFTASNAALSSAFPLETQAGEASAPSVSMAANGAAVVSWLQAVTAQANPNVVARVFRP